jgi:hypothetical protein
MATATQQLLFLKVGQKVLVYTDNLVRLVERILSGLFLLNLPHLLLRPLVDRGTSKPILERLLLDGRWLFLRHLPNKSGYLSPWSTARTQRLWFGLFRVYLTI